MKTNVFIIAAIGSFVAFAANAQTFADDQTPVYAQDSASESAVSDIEDAIVDDAKRGSAAFGNEGRIPGAYGSVAVRGTATSNDGVTSNDIGVGLRYGTFDGVNGIDLTAAFDYSDVDGTEVTNTLLLGADYRRDFNDTLFAYAKLSADMNKLAVDDSATQEIFVGAGIGYRIYNSADTQWSIQAGPGYLMSEYGPAQENLVATEDTDELAGSVSSNLFKSLTDTSFVTNDTDVIFTDLKTLVSNDLALNVSLTDSLLLRTSLTTSFDDAADDDFGDATNTFGVAVVYNFN